MKSSGFSLILMFLFILCLTACDLLYPPQYYQNIVANGGSSRGSGGAGSSSAGNWTSNSVSGFAMNAVIFTNNSCLFAADAHGNVWDSSDGGATWSSTLIVASINISSICWSGPGGYILVTVGSGAYAYYTGAWNNVLSATSVLNGSIYHNGAWILTGNNGLIMVCLTTPPTTGWATNHINAGVNAYGICYDGTSDSYFTAGDSGNVANQTNDNTLLTSSMWPLNIVGGNPNLRSICGNGSGTLMAVGQTGMICYTTNKGAMWMFPSSPTGGNINKVIWAPSINAFVAVGDNGILMFSQNGPTNWNIWNIGITFSVSENLNDICTFGSRFAIATSLGKVYVSP